MRRAIPIETVRAYVEDQFAQAEAAYERARGLTPDPRNPEWSRVWTRYAWIHWLLVKPLRRAERAGVGAVLALDLGDGLLEQLALLGEQLHAQARIAEPYGTTPVGTVPRDLTADAVEPYWVAATVLSASAERWQRHSDRETLARRVREKREQERAEIERVSQPGNEGEYRELARRQSEGVQPFAWTPRMAVRRDPNSPEPGTRDEEIERRLWQLNRDLGGATPIPGFEAAHRHAEAAACHYAAYRQLQCWCGGKTGERAQAFASIRLTQSHEALERALAAYQSTSVPRDRIAEEIASLSRLIK